MGLGRTPAVGLGAAAVAAVVLPLVALASVGVIVMGGVGPGSAAADAAGGDVLVEGLGWSPVVASAAGRAVGGAGARVPGCQARLALVAAVVEVEAAGGRGRSISPAGDTSPRLIGPTLDGTTPGTATIADTDGGRWDDDATWDHAVGIAQFLPSTWAASGIDGNGDGMADPHNVFDAIASQVAKLCRDGHPMATADDERRALFAYNPATWYVDRVMAEAARIQTMLDDAGAGSRAGIVVDRPGGGTVELATVRGITVAATIANRLEALLNAASAAGVELSGTGWRSTQRQAELRQENGCPDIYTAPPDTCRVPTAIPGTSMHEIGEAIDFTENGTTLTRSSTAFTWLATNATQYGFSNLPSEAWHWSVNGK